jgi:hypothetical protein
MTVDPFLEAEEETSSAALGAVPEYPTAALPPAARELVDYGVASGLPGALVAGAALAAAAAAIGPNAQIEVSGRWHERPIIWTANIAPRGAGKTPSQDLAFDPLRNHDAQVAEEEEGTEILLGDQTLEALARTLHESHGAGALDLDELSVLLRGIGEYKGGGGGDRGRLLQLWSGAPWAYTRVGGGGNKANAVKVRVGRPTLVICGGLQNELHELLGDEQSGMRPRWLLHLAEMPTSEGTLHGAAPTDWQLLLGGLLIPLRSTSRTWRLDEQGRAAFQHYRNAWKAQAREIETASTTAALVKADIHLARVALVFAEAGAPAGGGTIPVELIDRAAAVIEYTLNCWRAIPEQGGMSLSYRDETLDRGMPRLVAWLEEHGGQASRRELQRARVAGVRTGRDLDLLLLRYQDTYPGAVADVQPGHGGIPTTIVRAPARRPVSPLSPYRSVCEDKPRSRAKSDGKSSGDTALSPGEAVTPTGRQDAVSPESGDTDVVTPTRNPVSKGQNTHIHPGDTGTGDTAHSNGHDDLSPALLAELEAAGASYTPHGDLLDEHDPATRQEATP